MSPQNTLTEEYSQLVPHIKFAPANAQFAGLQMYALTVGLASCLSGRV
jgi:hypothetical protein